MKKIMDDEAVKHFSRLFDYMYMHRIDTWDYQLQYLIFKKGAFSIVPNKCLVKI